MSATEFNLDFHAGSTTAHQNVKKYKLSCKTKNGNNWEFFVTVGVVAELGC